MLTKHEKQFNVFAGVVGAILTLLIAVVMIHGDRVEPQVKQFNLEDSAVSVTADQLIFTFNREMDKESVENSFELEPNVEGQFSWAGRKLYYTLFEPLDYGQEYKISVDATDKNGREMIPFDASFTSFKKELFYIQVEGDTRQVVGYQPDTEELTTYTPEDLLVLDYDFVHGGKAIAFLALEASLLNRFDSIEDFDALADLYLMDLGSRELIQLTDDENILNLSMTVAPDGETIAMMRLELNPDTGSPLGLDQLWIGDLSGEFEPFWYANLNPDENIQFTPDSKWILVLVNEGFSMLPLEITGGPPQALGNFYNAFGFSDDGSQLVFTQWKDKNPFAETMEIVLMHRNGDIKTLLSDIGEIDHVAFNHKGSVLYASIFEPYKQINAIYKYDLTTEKLEQLTEIVALGFYTDQTVSVDEKELGYEGFIDKDLIEVKLMDLASGEELYSDRGTTPRSR